MNSPVSFLICTNDNVIYADVEQRLVRAIPGAKIDRASDGADANRFLNEHYPSVIYISQSFDEGGFEFCTLVRRKRGYAEQPVIMLLERITEQAIERVTQCGASDFDCRASGFQSLAFRTKQLLKQSQSRDNKAKPKETTENLHIDTLTGLLNRQHFHMSFEQSLNEALEAKRLSAVLLIDIDDFKRINSSFDYQTGDYLLRLVARRLSSVVRGNDILMRESSYSQTKKTLARFGGDEFTLFADGIEAEGDVTAIVERCLKSISSPIVLDGHEVTLKASIGIALVQKDGEDVSTLLRNAERAMYEAKRTLDNSYAFYDSEMASAAQTRFLMESELRKAIENDQLSINFQPFVSLNDGFISSMEVLCRWNHPEMGTITPDQFIPLAEETGLIISLGNWVFKESCRQIAEWLEQGTIVNRVAINISSMQFNHSNFVSHLEDILIETNVSASHIELELTESIVMRDIDENISKLKALKSLGFTIAIDDFGTGYSSLSYLKKLPINTLKIDRSFVSNIAEKATDMAIIEAILALAEKLGLSVVAEGIETAEQLAFFKDRHCQWLQGYLFSPAKPANVMTDMLGTYNPLLAE
ncbi:GGDEF domain-containing response regulator [Alteromonadaceae bacterium M269]|nr:GGDEF domain-containing response regulator [Alteromonadaceae bacterium M269]